MSPFAKPLVSTRGLVTAVLLAGVYTGGFAAELSRTAQAAARAAALAVAGISIDTCKSTKCNLPQWLKDVLGLDTTA